MQKTSTSHLSYDEAKEMLNNICNEIKLREEKVIEEAGVNTNSTIAGFCNGSLTVKTTEETLLIHNLKQTLMSKTGEQMEAAKQRNLARRAARKAARINMN